jgi:hypothetical protein
MLATKSRINQISVADIPDLFSDEYNQELLAGLDNPVNIDLFHQNLELELGDVRKFQLQNPMLQPIWHDRDNFVENLVDFSRDPKNIGFVCEQILGIQLPPYQLAILEQLWDHKVVAFIASRGAAKSYILGIYIILRMILNQGIKIAVVGAALRQSLVIFNYILQIWNNAPILRDICGNANNPKKDPSTCSWVVGLSRCIFLPLGDGETIRGQRANIIIADEFSSIDPEIFEKVVYGFAAVKTQNFYENIQLAHQKKLLDLAGIEYATIESGKVATIMDSNQIIVSGTPSFEFNHFYRYFKTYHAIITCNGDPVEIKKVIPEYKNVDAIDARDYCIIRLPSTKLFGQMDEVVINQAKATMDPNIAMMEFGACFARDSAGFYTASAIQRSTCPIKVEGKVIADYGPMMWGSAESFYVMGIDPASEEDNFAISIIELVGRKRVIRYMWTSNRKKFEEAKKQGLISQQFGDYNSYCIFQIRALIRRFNIQHICLDTGGGGFAIREALKDASKLLDSDDKLILEIDDEETDLVGQHILEMINFSDVNWRKESHHGLKQDIADCTLLFPHYDSAELAVQKYKDNQFGVIETLEDVYLEIEQAKYEMIMIKYSLNNNNQEKWDVPDAMTFNAQGEKQKLKRDRFTAILLSNWAARKRQMDVVDGNKDISYNSIYNPSAETPMGAYGGRIGRKNFGQYGQKGVYGSF